MAAEVEAVKDAEIHHVRQNGEWAMFVLRHWNRVKDPLGRGTGGSLVVHSSYGSFSYIWGATGCPFKQFLVEHLAKDRPYTMHKFLNDKYREFSLERTVEALKRKLIEQRREDAQMYKSLAYEFQHYVASGRYIAQYTRDDFKKKMAKLLDKDTARELWESLEACADRDELEDIIRSESADKAWPDYGGFEFVQQEEVGWVKHFWQELFLPYVEHIAQTIKK